ncbi:MAG TPA: PSD1 and planctomycete cytochrome C domain-containing protein [Pirellulales bacterium]|jgi:hypothetical protein|nr:PSD1 and planctomycete cytochrome C domain-containing protein [Pirellulales bacterium]
MSGSRLLADGSRALAALLFAAAPLWAGVDKIDFSRDVRPVLSDKCFACHGPDEKHREAELRLDVHDAALKVVVPGKSGESELVRRITSTDPDEVMPPPKSHRTLTPAEIALITRWIDQGAPWGEHWAFRKLEKPALPAATNSAAATNPATATGSAATNDPSAAPLAPIDALIAPVLARHGLEPAPPAPRETLIRRASLDLTGLPPTPDELAAFMADTDPAAYEKLVDRLLASPAFGERMAWEWLDAARYADSNGYQGDIERTMWPWRDWVVDALNRNLPFDQFTVWQLAGDLLPEATFEQRLATGFCRNYMINGEGGRIAEENRVDYAMDMAETTATVWLGLTTNCCRCHDHKFDPLTQRDYYRLLAYFNQTPIDGGGGNPQTLPVLEVLTDQEKRSIAEMDETLARTNRSLAARTDELLAGQADWEQRQLASGASEIWSVLNPLTAKADHQSLTVQPDQSILASGENPQNDTYTVTAQLSPGRLTAVRLEALRDPSMTQNGLARSDSGNFVLTEFEISLSQSGGAEPRRLAIGSAEATFEQGGFQASGAFDGNPVSGWAVWEGHPVDREHQAVFRLKEPLDVGPGATLTFVLRHDSAHRSHNLGRFRLSTTGHAEPKLGDPRQPLLAAIEVPAASRSPQQAELIATAYHRADDTYRQLEQERHDSEEKLKNAHNATPKVMVMADLPQPRKTFMLDRGLYNQPGAEVSAGVPASLPPLDVDAPPNRLALARWLVSADQPLTARVTVNRVWQQLFGIGLVKTTENLGAQSEMPLELDLLDWLAADFRDSGWNLKGLVRGIVTSRAYRQSSKVSPDLLDRDPENRLLARGPRFRMPSWMLRDQALAASGLLVARLGGPPVKGYQPTGVWEEATFGTKRYVQDHGESLYRRSLYTFWRRIVGPTMFFDNSARQICTVKVFRTNTPLQALLTLNDVTFVEAARALAQRVMAAGSADFDAQLDVVYRRVLCRGASPAERDILRAGLERSRGQFRQQPADADKLLAVGESPRDKALDPIEHASWTTLCLAVLNLDEALTKE